SHSMDQFLATASAQYDVVLLDTAPLLPVTDGAILAAKASGALLVVGSDQIHQSQLAGSLESLESVDARLLGLVLNMVQRKHADRYTDYRYHATYAPEPPSDTPPRRGARRGPESPAPPKRDPTPAFDFGGEPEQMPGQATKPASSKVRPPSIPPRHATPAGRRRREPERQQ